MRYNQETRRIEVLRAGIHGKKAKGKYSFRGYQDWCMAKYAGRCAYISLGAIRVALPAEMAGKKFHLVLVEKENE